MPTTIQIRGVPDELHRNLEARAALAGQSLSDYLLRELREIAARPMLEGMLARLSTHEPATLSTDPAEIIREARDSR